MRSEAFAWWQPRYAEHGIPTFPVNAARKTPAVRGYQRVGLRGSAALAAKRPDANAFGFCPGKHSKITVLDVDTPDERVLADALHRHGPTPLIVRSGSGNYQAWYRHDGEGRQVRPDPQKPIDILGAGYVIAPQSRGARGYYQIVEGTLDDLDRLPVMRAANDAAQPEQLSAEGIPVGQRNDALWRHCMAAARVCPGITDLMENAMSHNQSAFYEPLPDSEVLKVVASAWAKELAGENWFGRGQRIVSTAAEVDGLLSEYPDAYLLLTILRRHHWGREFVIANAMAEQMPSGGWRRKRLAAARQYLEEEGFIEMVRPASRFGGPALYRFKGGQN